MPDPIIDPQCNVCTGNYQLEVEDEYHFCNRSHEEIFLQVVQERLDRSLAAYVEHVESMTENENDRVRQLVMDGAMELLNLREDERRQLYETGTPLGRGHFYESQSPLPRRGESRDEFIDRAMRGYDPSAFIIDESQDIPDDLFGEAIRHHDQRIRDAMLVPTLLPGQEIRFRDGWNQVRAVPITHGQFRFAPDRVTQWFGSALEEE
jgi:hypothetical protein